MPLSAATLQTELDAVNAQILKALKGSLVQTFGTMIQQQSIAQLRAHRDALQQQLDRVTGASPMFVRGRVTGLGRG
jgi:hypothetical protein